MTAITPVRPVRVIAAQLDRIVVPSDTAALAIASESVLSATTVGAWVDSFLVPESVAITGVSTPRQSTPGFAGQRAIYLVNDDSSLIGSAPAAVTALLTSLGAASPDSYILWDDPATGVWVVGRGGYANGLRHGVFELLRQAGSDWGSPSPAWRVRPRRANLRPSSMGLRVPATGLYRFDGEGGIGSGSVPPIPAGAREKASWANWKIILRGPYEYSAPTQQGENVTYSRQYEYGNDHRYMSWSVQRQARGYSETGAWPGAPLPSKPTNLAHWNPTYHGSGGGSLPSSAGSTPWVSAPAVPPTNSALAADVNPDADTDPATSDYAAYNGTSKLVGDLLIGAFRLQIGASPNTIKDPASQYMSVERADGNNYDGSTKTRNLLRNGPYASFLTPQQQQSDASAADGEAHLANMIAKANAAVWASSSFKPRLSRLGYNGHTVPPAIPIEPGILIMLLNGAITARGTQLEYAEILPAWQAKSALNVTQGKGVVEFGVTPIWLQTSLNFFCMPRLDQRAAAVEMKAWLTAGARGINAQSTYSHGCLGFLYWAIGRLSWDPTLDIDALIAEYFPKFFGAAATYVQRMFTRWWRWFEYSANEIGESCNDMLAAQTALDGAPDTGHQSRLDEVKCFVQYLRLWLEFCNVSYFAATLNASGPASPTVSFAPSKATGFVFDLRARITSGHAGADGVAQFDYSLDGGTSYTLGGTIPAGGGSVTLPSAAGSLVFATGTYDASTTWARDLTTIDSASDALLSWLWNVLETCQVDSNRMATLLNKQPLGALPTALAATVKWDYTNSGAAGWATVAYPSSAAIQALMTSGASTYAPLVSRELYSTTSFSVLTPNASAVSVNTVSLVDSSDWVFSKAAGTTTISATMSSPWAGDNVVTRFVIKDPATGTVLQTISVDVDAFVPSVGGAPGIRMYGTIDASSRTVRVRIDTSTTFSVSYDGGSTYAHTGVTIPAPGARYNLDGVLQFASIDFSGTGYVATQTYDLPIGQNRTFPLAITVGSGVLRLHVAENDRDRQYFLTAPESFALTQVGVQKYWENDLSRSLYFYVPTGQTKIVMCGILLTDPTLKDDTGAAVTVTKISPTTWTASVASGRSGKAWSVSNMRTLVADFPFRIVNCPSFFAPSAKQLMIPTDAP